MRRMSARVGGSRRGYVAEYTVRRGGRGSLRAGAIEESGGLR